MLQQLQLVVHHFLIAFDVLFEDDLDGDLAGGAFGLADDAVGACSLENGLVSFLCPRRGGGGVIRTRVRPIL